MNDNMNKEQWVNAVIGSTNGMKQAEANPYLYQKVLHKLKEQNQPVEVLPGFVVRRWAIAATVVMILNVLTVVHYTTTGANVSKEQAQNALSQEMGLNSTYNF